MTSSTTDHLTVDQLAQGDPQQLADECGIPVVWCDHQVTRRQRLHGANVPGGDNAYTSTHFNEILQHVALEGYDCGIFICETPRRQHLACYIEFHEIERHGTG